MATTSKVSEGDYIEMLASIAGDNFSYAPGQVLIAAQDIPLELAQAYVAEPEDEPRARVISPERARHLLATNPEDELMRSEAPPAERDPNPPAPPPATEPPKVETPEILEPIFAALYAGETPEVDDEQRAAIAALLEQDPENELAPQLTSLLEETTSAEVTTDEQLLEPIFAAIAEDKHGILLSEEERLAATQFVEANPDDERTAPLQALLAKGGDAVNPDADEKRSEAGTDETRPAPEAEKRETATQRGGRGRGGRAKPPEDAEKKE